MVPVAPQRLPNALPKKYLFWWRKSGLKEFRKPQYARSNPPGASELRTHVRRRCEFFAPIELEDPAITCNRAGHRKAASLFRPILAATVPSGREDFLSAARRSR